MSEGGLDAPVRHPIPWQDEAFYDAEKIDEELRRVFDVCHGCRRCFNLCDSFPRLFDLIDDSESGELDTVSSADFGPVVEACTLCDMCFMTKCPYVPPHEFDLDFPHLMLRYRAAELKARGKAPFIQNQLAKTDRNGELARPVAGLANWGSKKSNTLTRPMMDKIAGIDRDADLPIFESETFQMAAAKADRDGTAAPNPDGPAKGRKAAIFATCFSNYNDAAIGIAARKVLAHLGVETRVDYPACCGMPFLEQGNLEKVAEQARTVSSSLRPLIDQGYDIIAPVASCGLMMKFEWPLILPDDENVKKLSEATRDINEYVVDIARNEGLTDGLKPVDGGVAVHLACHARAQNMGPKAADLLKLIPETPVDVVERCSGHGGTFGVLKETHGLAVKVGRPAARAAGKGDRAYIASDCPLAAKHLSQLVADQKKSDPPPSRHPIQIFAQAYGLTD